MPRSNRCRLTGVRGQSEGFSLLRQVGQTGYIYGNASEAPWEALIHNIFPFSFPQCWTHAKSPRNFLFIFFLFIPKIRANPDLPGPDTGHISWWTDFRQLNQDHWGSQRWHNTEIITREGESKYKLTRKRVWLLPYCKFLKENNFPSNTGSYKTIFGRTVWEMILWQARHHQL